MGWQHFQASALLPLTSAIDKSQQHQNKLWGECRESNSGPLLEKQERNLPLCYAAPPTNKVFNLNKLQKVNRFGGVWNYFKSIKRLIKAELELLSCNRLDRLAEIDRAKVTLSTPPTKYWQGFPACSGLFFLTWDSKPGLMSISLTDMSGWSRWCLTAILKPWNLCLL